MITKKEALRSRIQPLALVNGELESYARRGVFRSFSQTYGDDKLAEFSFYWLWNLPFHLTFDVRRKALSFKNLLPDVPAGSELESGLKALIKSRSSSSSSRDQPEHRRLDPKRVSIHYSNRRGQVSLVFRVSNGEYQHAVTKALNLVNEIFVGFLNAQFPEYTAQHFRRQED